MRKKHRTVEQLAEEWIGVRKTEVKVSTISTYSYILSHYIVPFLGQCRAEELTTDRILEFSRTLRSKELEARTVNGALMVLKMVLHFAGQRGYAVPEHCEIKNLKERGKQIRILREEDQRRLERFLQEDQDRAREGIRAGIILSLYTGLRIGEICALRWEDIDLREGMLYVRRNISRVQSFDSQEKKRTRIEIGMPKTETSFRQIPLPVFLRSYLRKIRKAPDRYLLTAQKKYMEPRAYQYQYKKIMRELGLDQCNYHMLRHTFATRCIEAGFDVKSLSEILGHASVSITLNRYAHPTMRMKLQNMEKLRDIYLGAG